MCGYVEMYMEMGNHAELMPQYDSIRVPTSAAEQPLSQLPEMSNRIFRAASDAAQAIFITKALYHTS